MLNEWNLEMHACDGHDALLYMWCTWSMILVKLAWMIPSSKKNEWCSLMSKLKIFAHYIKPTVLHEWRETLLKSQVVMNLENRSKNPTQRVDRNNLDERKMKYLKPNSIKIGWKNELRWDFRLPHHGRKHIFSYNLFIYLFI